MKIGDLVTNSIAIGISRSWRPEGHKGIIINISKVPLNLGHHIGVIETTDLDVLLDDGTIGTYDSGSFKIVDH